MHNDYKTFALITIHYLVKHLSFTHNGKLEIINFSQEIKHNRDIEIKLN